MNEFERQVKANRQRSDIQEMNKELQKSDLPLLYGGTSDVQNLNTTGSENEQGERKSA